MGANQQTSVPAFTSGQVLTAQQQTEINTGVPVFADTTARDAAFGGSGEKVLAEGQLAYLEDANVVQYYDGADWATVGPSALTTATATVATSQSTSSTTYTDLATAGPAVTLTTGTQVLVFTNTETSTAAGRYVFADFAISGATTRAATDDTCAKTGVDPATTQDRVSVSNLVTVTAGSNTFTMKYRTNAGTSSFSNRTIIVVAL
jgi:muramidase (phage lysozyme)